MKLTKPKLPTSVKIGYIVYDIVDWNHEIADARNNYGEIDYVKNTIKVDTEHGGVKAANTLLHEIIHGVHRSASAHEVEGATEEFLTCIYADGLTQVFMDNPDVLDFIKESCNAK